MTTPTETKAAAIAEAKAKAKAAAAKASAPEEHVNTSGLAAGVSDEMKAKAAAVDLGGLAKGVDGLRYYRRQVQVSSAKEIAALGATGDHDALMARLEAIDVEAANRLTEAAWARDFLAEVERTKEGVTRDLLEIATRKTINNPLVRKSLDESRQAVTVIWVTRTTKITDEHGNVIDPVNTYLVQVSTDGKNGVKRTNGTTRKADKSGKNGEPYEIRHISLRGTDSPWTHFDSVKSAAKTADGVYNPARIPDNYNARGFHKCWDVDTIEYDEKGNKKSDFFAANADTLKKMIQRNCYDGRQPNNPDSTIMGLSENFYR
jgi:hypothetical protein